MGTVEDKWGRNRVFFQNKKEIKKNKKIKEKIQDDNGKEK